MKYEPIFGDQSLFRFGPQNAVSVRYGKDVHGNDNYIFDSGEIKATTGQLRDTPVIAMRRIIKEPKRWTWEDKKAGRLPEVGCKIAGKRTGINTVLFNNGDYIVTVSDGHCVGKYIADEVFAYFKPIETPAEKAQREEDEFIGSLVGTDIHGSTIKEIFDQGARTAYRKLKGGE